MALVREDSTGLHIHAGGRIFRPGEADAGYGHAVTRHSRYQPGEKVKARHYGGTPLAQVGEELWYNFNSEIPS